MEPRRLHTPGCIWSQLQGSAARGSVHKKRETKDTGEPQPERPSVGLGRLGHATPTRMPVRLTWAVVLCGSPHLTNRRSLRHILRGSGHHRAWRQQPGRAHPGTTTLTVSPSPHGRRDRLPGAPTAPLPSPPLPRLFPPPLLTDAIALQPPPMAASHHPQEATAQAP